MDAMMTLLMSFSFSFSFWHWEDDGESGCSRDQQAFPWSSAFGIFFYDILLFFVSSASGMTCGYLSRTGAAHCDLSLFCLVLLLSFFLSILLVLIFLLVDVRRAWL